MNFNFVNYEHDCANCGIALSGFRTYTGDGSLKTVEVEQAEEMIAKCHECGHVHTFRVDREIIVKGVVMVSCKPSEPEKRNEPHQNTQTPSSGKAVLTDNSAMPFGKYYKAGKTMSEVPAAYFHYLWSNGMREKPSDPVGEYIRRNLTVLKTQFDDGIWD